MLICSMTLFVHTYKISDIIRFKPNVKIYQKMNLTNTFITYFIIDKIILFTGANSFIKNEIN